MGFPLILNADYTVHWVSLHYFIDCARTKEVSSIATYAGHLTDFISQLEADQKEISAINDAWLRAYKAEVLQRGRESGYENTQNYASQLLRSVVAYCYWLTENSLEPYLCGTSKRHKIQVRLGKRGSIKHETAKNQASDKRPILVPRSEWIEIVKAYGPARSDLSKRFELMLDWGRCAGLRSHEACFLRIDQLPLRETAEKALETGRNIPVTLTRTKGGKRAQIFIHPTLVIDTWDYIQLYRINVVRRFRQRAKKGREVYLEPQEIFLSDKTGKGINKVSFSNSVRKAFLSAVDAGELTLDERVWAHGLRHNFITWLLQAMDRSNQKHAERLAIQSTRHASVDAMNPYLSERFNQDFT